MFSVIGWFVFPLMKLDELSINACSWLGVAPLKFYWRWRTVNLKTTLDIMHSVLQTLTACKIAVLQGFKGQFFGRYNGAHNLPLQQPVGKRTIDEAIKPHTSGGLLLLAVSAMRTTRRRILRTRRTR